MANFCYLIGDDTSKTCALIDPAFETDRILDEANRLGYKIDYIINTHSHSDHTAGNGAIKKATGARLLIHELDAKKICQSENREALGVGIPINRVGFDV